MIAKVEVEWMTEGKQHWEKQRGLQDKDPTHCPLPSHLAMDSLEPRQK